MVSPERSGGGSPQGGEGGHSYALIADGIESVNDIVASLIVLFSLRISAMPPDADHPYGHGKAEQLGAVFSALSR